MKYTPGSILRSTLYSSVAMVMMAGSSIAQEGPVQIGFTTAITGPFNEFGEGIRRGVEIAVEQWNANGGINGRPVAIGEA